MEDNFFAIDKLVEFGLSMAVAQQMVKTMNHTMDHMHVSGHHNTHLAPMQALYYAVIDNQQAGPFSEHEISRLITSKEITKESFIWKPGLSNWVHAEQIPEILKLVILCPPTLPKP
jgi:hypothetical protein